ncbi:MAG: TlpA family protein disulfide reductase [bacterium]
MKYLVCLITLCAFAHLPQARAVGPGDIAPPFIGTNLVDGQTVKFPELLSGKPAVVVFWATWCPYCKAFMPYAKDIQAQYADAGVQIVTLNSKERGRGDPKAYVDTLNFPMYAIAEADAIGEAYGINFIPGLLVVDGAGKVVYRRRSTDLPAGKTVSEQWAEEVRQVLNQLVR